MVFVVIFLAMVLVLGCVVGFVVSLLYSGTWLAEKTTCVPLQLVIIVLVASVHFTAAAAIIPWIQVAVTTLRSLV